MIELPEPLGSGVVFVATCAVVFLLSAVASAGVFFFLWLRVFTRKVFVRWRTEKKV